MDNISSSVLCELGDLTGCFREHFLMRFEVHGFKMQESYELARDGNSYKRKLQFCDKVSKTCVIGQRIDLPCSWAATVRCKDGHASVGLLFEKSLLNERNDKNYYVFCKLKIDIVDKEDDVLYSQNWRAWSTATRIYVGEEYSFPNFISLEDLADNEIFFVHDEILRLKCEGVLYTDFQHRTIVRVDGQPINCRMTESAIGPKLWRDTNFSDIQLVSRDEKIIPAHKLILCNASLVWKNLIYPLNCGGGDAQEKENTLQLEDMSLTELEKMLEFIYTGEVDLEWENLDEVGNLITAASNYEVIGLKTMCFEKILGVISLSQFTDVVQLAFLHSVNPKVMGVLRNFFLRNQDKMIYQKKFREFAKDVKNKEIFLGLVCCGAVK